MSIVKEAENQPLPPITVDVNDQSFINELIKAQNKTISNFLMRKNPKFNPYSVSTPAIEVINELAECLFFFPERQKIIAQILLHTLGEYGGIKREAITSFHQQKIINDWMCHQVFGMSLETWFLNTLESIKKQNQKKDNTDYTVARLHLLLTRELDKTHIEQGKLSQMAKDYFWSKVVAFTLPSLEQSVDEPTPSLYGNIIIDSPEWGYIYAGLLFAYQLGTDTSHWAAKDAITMGQTLEILLHENAVPEAYVGYFLLPALVHHVFIEDSIQ